MTNCHVSLTFIVDKLYCAHINYTTSYISRISPNKATRLHSKEPHEAREEW